MNNQNQKENEKIVHDEKHEIPKDVQKRMLEFFLQTSIPRKKANQNLNPLSERKMED